MMRNSIKCALFSGLVLPGLGQIYLKYYFRGISYTIITLACVSLLVYKMITIFQLMFDKILHNANGMIDIHAIRFQIQEILNHQNLLPYEIAGYLSLIIWVHSTVEAYFLGLKKDKTSVQPLEAKNLKE